LGRGVPLPIALLQMTEQSLKPSVFAAQRFAGFAHSLDVFISDWHVIFS
jgi:hypothetical protein